MKTSDSNEVLNFASFFVYETRTTTVPAGESGEAEGATAVRAGAGIIIAEKWTRYSRREQTIVTPISRKVMHM